MNYEKAYKKALEKAKEFYILCKKCGAKSTVDFLEDTFPELNESEDERIRKEMIKFLIDVNNGAYTKSEIEITSWIAWLEKKGEKNPTWTEEDECCMGECISAIATKDGWSFEEKRKTKHWLNSIKQRLEEQQ